MEITLVAVTMAALAAILAFKLWESRRTLAETRRDLDAGTKEAARFRSEAEAAFVEMQRVVDRQLDETAAESERIRAHYAAEAARVKAEAERSLAAAMEQLDSLRKFQGLLDEEGSSHLLLTNAITEATAVRDQARELLAAARLVAGKLESEAAETLKAGRARADAALDHATRTAGQMITTADKKALEIGGDAYRALREKESLDLALTAIRNLIDGYGDRYVVPTRSILDGLGAEFGHTEAGQRLIGAREQTKRLVEEGHAATCDYAEENRRTTAIRFVIDAFNGRVDAILSRSRHDNHGSLAQEIRDAYALVNLNGTAFRNARILSAYLDSRLEELTWAVATHELRMREREEQRRLKEQIREEERAQREYERAIQEAEREERAIQKALAKTREEIELASAGERAELEARITALNERLTAAEAKNQRALSMAQQTRKGTIYVISNVGSFGEQVFKIGMTRRLEPNDRVKELSDASVPFEFDVHAMLSCDDAPALEARLHRAFDQYRVNKVNYRKEFFRVPLESLRDSVVATGAEVSFTMLAEAREYRETQALDKMTPEERARYLDNG